MPKITVGPNGIKGGMSHAGNSTPPKRGLTRGWTHAVSRRNRDFLHAVDGSALDGFGLALSFTVGRDAGPVTPDQMRRWRRMLEKRLVRAGLLRLHWLLEFQGDGTPHLHGIAFISESHGWDPVSYGDQLRMVWCQITAETGSSYRGQHVRVASALVGWFQYLAKHGSRGAAHYQREMPKGWENPGAMWGKVGKWPLERDEVEIDRVSFHALRRIVDRWQSADIRKDRLAAKTPAQVKAARKRYLWAQRLRRGRNRRASEVRGFAEWISDDIGAALVLWAVRERRGWLRDWDERDETPPVTEAARPALPMKGRRDAQPGRGREVRS